MSNIQATTHQHNNAEGTRALSSLIKDVVDRIGAVIALILFSPIFLIVMPMIMRDGGSAFYGHTRIGKNGRAFKCWKFRSMVMNGDDVLKKHLAENEEARKEWEADFKLRNDPRITKIGHFLRKTSLDELPQFWNVLIGEMSLVGPRPVVADEQKYYGDNFKVYLSVKPGVTGLWQVSGRNNTTYEERVALDVEYVQNRSTFGDIAIMFRTIHVVITGHGAY